MGASFDVTNSYSAGLLALLLMSLISVALLGLASRRSHVATIQPDPV